jgi:hypothetical protein
LLDAALVPSIQGKAAKATAHRDHASTSNGLLRRPLRGGNAYD